MFGASSLHSTISKSQFVKVGFLILVLKLCELAAGYAVAKYAPPKPTGVQAALYSVESQETLEIIGKLTRNVVINPTEDKYRKIKLTNPKINQTVTQAAGGVESMLAMGWTYEAEDKENLVLAKGAKISMAEVRAVMLDQSQASSSFQLRSWVMLAYL